MLALAISLRRRDLGRARAWGVRSCARVTMVTVWRPLAGTDAGARKREQRPTMAVAGRRSLIPSGGSVNRTRALSVVVGLLAGTATAAPLAAQTQIVYGPGTTHTNAGTSTGQPAATDVPCVTSGASWCATNVIGNGRAGITTDFARSGNGSIFLTAPGGGKADFQSNGARPLFMDTPFQLRDFVGASYDWYKSSVGSVTTGSGAPLAPAFRLGMYSTNTNGTLSGFLGSLVFEPYYQPGFTSIALDTWNTSVVGTTSRVWCSRDPGSQTLYALANFQSVGGQQCGQTATTITGNAWVGFLNVGIGTWGDAYTGAVDNVSYRTAGMQQAVNFNFEVVPEPSTYVLMGTGLLALGGVAARRRRTS